MAADPAYTRSVYRRADQGGRYIEIPGADNYTWAGDTTALVAEIQEFLTVARPVVEAERVLATVLCTDIVESTEVAADLGDAAWRAAQPHGGGGSSTRPYVSAGTV